MQASEIATEITNLSIADIGVLGAELHAHLGHEGFSFFLSQLESSSPLSQRYRVNTTNMVAKISVIKAIRLATGMGLKEAKDLSESDYGGFFISIPRDKIIDFKFEVEKAGCVVSLA